MVYNFLTRKIVIFVMVLASLGQVFPLAWLLNYSLCTTGELFSPALIAMPKVPQWRNYLTVFERGNVMGYLFNSIFVCIISISLVVVLASMMSFAFTHMEWKLKGIVSSIVTIGIMIPIHATLLPNYVSFNTLGITNGYLGMIIPYVAFGLPLAVFIISSFIYTVPFSVQESAVIDGCNIFQLIFHIVFPMIRPAMATVIIMTFISTWNEYIMAATYTASNKIRTLPFVVQNFIGEFQSDYALQFTSMVIVAAPTLIIYVFLSEQITKGVQQGALKG